MLPILPATIDIIFKTADIMLIIIVTIHAHPLPFNRPHATTKFAIPRTINIAPSIPINPPSTNNGLFGMGLVGEFRSFRCLEDKVPTSCMKSKLIQV